jgi:hypothetical protein
MRNQYSGLFTCIMDYLHVLCIILMVLSCVLCMTLMVFIYVYYGLFACTNLVDVMPLFFHGFFIPSTDFWQKSPDFCQNSPGNRHANFWEKPADLSVKPTAFRSSRFSLFLHRLRCVLAEFCRISPIFPNFPKTDRIGEARFSSFRRIFEHWVQDLDSSPRAFHRAGGRSHSLDRRQNRYSHVTAGTVAGSSHDHGASRSI